MVLSIKYSTVCFRQQKIRSRSCNKNLFWIITGEDEDQVNFIYFWADQVHIRSRKCQDQWLTRYWLDQIRIFSHVQDNLERMQSGEKKNKPNDTTLTFRKTNLLQSSWFIHSNQLDCRYGLFKCSDFERMYQAATDNISCWIESRQEIEDSTWLVIIMMIYEYFANTWKLLPTVEMISTFSTQKELIFSIL